MKQSIRLTESELKDIIKESVMEYYGMGSYAQVRPNSAKLNDLLDQGVIDAKQLAEDLIGWMDDNDVARFMVANGYEDEDDDSNEDEDDNEI
jgi:hypothetical protein